MPGLECNIVIESMSAIHMWSMKETLTYSFFYGTNLFDYVDVSCVCHSSEGSYIHSGFDETPLLYASSSATCGQWGKH